MDALYDSSGVRKVRRFDRSLGGLEHLYLDEDTKVEDAIHAMLQDPNVEYAQPNYILSIPQFSELTYRSFLLPEDGPCETGAESPGCPSSVYVPCLIPGIPFPPGCSDSPPSVTRPVVGAAPKETVPAIEDPDLKKVYGLKKIGATEAWKKVRGSKKVIVAIIDSGIDYNHEDLSFNMWRNLRRKNEEPVGYDFVHDDGLPYDDNHHGTHTAGIVGAVGGNGKGVSGVNQVVSLMALKFMGADGKGNTANAIRAMDYAIRNGAKVLNNSWSSDSGRFNRALYDAIERAKAKNVLFIAAAGNDGTDNDGEKPAYPASFDNDNLISVAASNRNDVLASFSNYGKKTVHIAAPGSSILSTTPHNKYDTFSGTSMAAPHVAGAAALLWAQNPSWSYKKVKELLLNASDKVSTLSDKTVTGGRLNVLKAIQSSEN